MPEIWPGSTQAARALQTELAGRVIRHRDIGQINLVGGTDVAFPQGGRLTRGAVVVMRYPALDVVETAVATRATTLPYIPGLLSFRECPVLIDALAQVQTIPDVLLIDGNGIAHPRHLGLASHLGVLTGLATIGVAKSKLLGSHADVPEEKGAWVPWIHQGETIGAVVRTRARVRPVYVSIGHRVDLALAIELVMGCTTRYRLPETTRLADRCAGAG